MLLQSAEDPVAWYEEAFNEDYDRIYFPSFTEERNVAEVNFIESVLELRSGDEVLDLACGNGRHAVELARRGYRVIGLDLSARILDIASREAAAKDVEVKWVEADMRKIPARLRFDGIFSFFTSFGYFAHRENIKVLEAVARALRAGAHFLLETANRDWMLHQVESQPRRWEEISPGFLFLEDVTFNVHTSRIHTRRIVIDGQDRREVNFDLRLYSLVELEELFEQAGMKVVAAYGGKDKSPFSVSSQRMALVGKKI